MIHVLVPPFILISHIVPSQYQYPRYLVPRDKAVMNWWWFCSNSPLYCYQGYIDDRLWCYFYLPVAMLCKWLPPFAVLFDWNKWFPGKQQPTSKPQHKISLSSFSCYWFRFMLTALYSFSPLLCLVPALVLKNKWSWRRFFKTKRCPFRWQVVDLGAATFTKVFATRV